MMYGKYNPMAKSRLSIKFLRSDIFEAGKARFKNMQSSKNQLENQVKK